jgi:glycosyltransferase involved in cell wall biosynthesis
VRFAFDATPLSVPRTGIGNYVRGVLAGLASLPALEHEITAFALADRGGVAAVERALEGIPVEVLARAVPAANVVRRGWSTAGRPPLERWIGGFDALHLSDWWSPPQRSGARTTTIYDLVPLHAPELVRWRARHGHRATYRQARTSCDVVFAISGYTRDDVVRTLGVPQERVRVAYPGIDPVFSADGARADLGAPYVLSVSTLEPRKNLRALLAAHAMLGDGMELAVVGASGWGDVPALDRPGIRRLGYVDDLELAALYRGASVLVFPSLLEGFGMPVVEAMACGCPVVASSHPSLDEACGNAAVRADPQDPSALAEGVRRAVAEREELVARGKLHARRFTWQAAGRVFLEALVALARPAG